MGNSRRGFTKEFKIDAVKLITEQGYKISETARNLGIDPSVLRRWKEQVKNEGMQTFPGKGFMTLEKEELHRLRKEVKRLEMERDILKKGYGLLCQSVERRFDFIRQQMKTFPVTLLCTVMRVSRSGFYPSSLGYSTISEYRENPKKRPISRETGLFSSCP